ncbi:MAG: hypothetical protein IKQ13_01330 [Treponema sp.]|nr:hypothetical protein [Treponema sp.]
MKRRFLTFISLTVATLLPLLAPSCSGLATPSAPDAPEAQRYTLSGSFSMPYADAAPAEVTNATPSARNAVPDMSDLTYTVEAVRSDGHIERTTSEDHSTYTFTNLTAGSWQITAYAKTSSGTCVMQSETKSVTLSKSKPDANTSLSLEPASGSGDINLTISWDTNSGIGYCKWSSSDYSALEGSTENPSGSVTIDLRGLSARTYSIKLSFYSSKANEEAGLPPVYECMEYIAVYPGLTTTKWTAETASHIDSSGIFKVTSSCVETFVYRKIYVSQTGNDTSGNGTSEKPFATIEKAMTRLTEVATKGIRSGEISAATPWELHVSGTYTASSISGGGFLDIPSVVDYLKIVGEGSGATIDANTKGRVLNIPSSATVTLENITLKNGRATNGGGINNAGNLTINEGVTITGNTATSTNNDGGGGGIYNTGTLTMSAGEISDNTATKLGGGILNKGTVFMYGSAVIGDISKDECATEHSYSNTAGQGGGIHSYTGEVYLGYSDASHTAELTGGICYNYSPDVGGMYMRRDIFKIDSGSVSYNYGRGVYVGNQTNVDEFAYFTMSGGTISDNEIEAPGQNDQKNSGGGVYVGRHGIFTMTGGTISSNTAAIDGGGVYIPNRDDSSFTMSGGEISGNTATRNGDGVYVDKNVFTMSDSARIESNNDVYLTSGKYITIAGTLTGTSPVATITPDSYPAAGVNKQVLDGAGVSSNYSKFAVTPQADGTVWSIKSDGNLKKEIPTAADFTSADLIAAYRDRMIIEDGDTGFDTDCLADMDGKTLLTWMVYRISGEDGPIDTDVYTALTFSQVRGTSFHMTFKAYQDGTLIGDVDEDYDLSEYETYEDWVFTIDERGNFDCNDGMGDAIIYIDTNYPYAVSTGLYGDDDENGYYLIE